MCSIETAAATEVYGARRVGAAYPRARRWRMMPHGNYLMFFQVHGGEVRVGHIRHGAKRPFVGCADR